MTNSTHYIICRASGVTGMSLLPTGIPEGSTSNCSIKGSGDFRLKAWSSGRPMEEFQCANQIAGLLSVVVLTYNACSLRVMIHYIAMSHGNHYATADSVHYQENTGDEIIPSCK